MNKINFTIEGAGKIIGVGNGDPACHEPDKVAGRSAAGRAVCSTGWPKSSCNPRATPANSN
jgi:hypothetical protein